MKLYTKKGDQGSTGILGANQIPKDDIRIEAYGTVDELNSIIGVTIHQVNSVKVELIKIQNLLFEIGSELASVEPRNVISKKDISELENLIDKASEQTEELKSFILPGGTLGSSWLHYCRTVTRRAERKIVTLKNQVKINLDVLIFMNRLSDLFFAWARLENHVDSVEDVKWKSKT